MAEWVAQPTLTLPAQGVLRWQGTPGGATRANREQPQRTAARPRQGEGAPRRSSHQPLRDPGQTVKSTGRIEWPQGLCGRRNESLVSSGGAPPEGLVTLADWYLAEKKNQLSELSELMIIFKKNFKTLGCDIKLPILNGGSVKKSTRQPGEQNVVSESHVRKGIF